jgi:hypothetical protein
MLKLLNQKDSKLSTSSSAASRDHAKTSVLQELERAWQESEAAFFTRSFAWPKKSSQSFYSLKMSVPSQGEVDLPLPESLPKWGMIVDGVLYPLRALERYTVAKDFSCWPTPKMATPCASQANKPIRQPSPSRIKKEHGEDLQDSIGRLNPESIGKRLSVEFVECLMGYPFKWTNCERWAIQYVHSKSKKRSKS